MGQFILVSIGVFLATILLLVIILLVAKKYLSPSGSVDIVVNDDQTLHVTQGNSLMSTLNENGIYLPSACGGKASCGQCKVQVLEGGGEILDSERSHFTRKQIKDHWRLGCQCKVNGNLSIKVPESVLGVKEWECTVISNKNVSSFIKEFKVALPPGEHMDFIPCAAEGKANLHFTVSPEHNSGFKGLTKSVLSYYQRTLGVTFNVTFSEQKSSTDTIAVNMVNTPFREKDGTLLFRPAGHGALLANLNDLDADVVFIKNIDNVVPDSIKKTTFSYKKALAGVLLSLQEKIFQYQAQLASSASAELLAELAIFFEKELCVAPPANFEALTEAEQVAYFTAKLNRPIRVCGVVKNTGEPGGGPFWCKNSDGTVSLQIVESAQVDVDNAAQKQIFNESTHFNPVDLVCGLKNYKGEAFDLLSFRDPKTGFITIKSRDGKDVKAQELPGLWNGAMSDWNTLFVEVPLITFNPVKTVNDLLRAEHQS